MIQRIQTVYLLVAALLSLVLPFVLPLWPDGEGNLVSSGRIAKTGDTGFTFYASLLLVSGILSLLTVLSFKKRKTQLRINTFNIIVNLIILGLLIYHLLTLPGGTLVSEKGIGLLLPFVVIVLLAIAGRAIKKDENLVKSVDRLR